MNVLKKRKGNTDGKIAAEADGKKNMSKVLAKSRIGKAVSKL